MDEKKRTSGKGDQGRKSLNERIRERIGDGSDSFPKSKAYVPSGRAGEAFRAGSENARKTLEASEQMSASMFLRHWNALGKAWQEASSAQDNKRISRFTEIKSTPKVKSLQRALEELTVIAARSEHYDFLIELYNVGKFRHNFDQLAVELLQETEKFNAMLNVATQHEKVSFLSYVIRRVLGPEDRRIAAIYKLANHFGCEGDLWDDIVKNDRCPYSITLVKFAPIETAYEHLNKAYKEWEVDEWTVGDIPWSVGLVDVLREYPGKYAQIVGLAKLNEQVVFLQYLQTAMEVDSSSSSASTGLEISPRTSLESVPLVETSPVSFGGYGTFFKGPPPPPPDTMERPATPPPEERPPSPESQPPLTLPPVSPIARKTEQDDPLDPGPPPFKGQSI